MDILSDIIIHTKYCKYLDGLNRKETFNELIMRNMYMHIYKFPHLKIEIIKQYEYVFDKKVLPSMRSLQLAGKPIFVHNQRMYNCCYCPIIDIDVFGEIFFLLLCGCGVGFSVQQHHIAQLPKINKSIIFDNYTIGDTIEGWADSVKVLLRSCLCDDEVNKNINPVFDYSKVREKGKKLKTTGGYAPGFSVLKDSLDKIRDILLQKKNNGKLSSLEVHDIICHIAESVYSGGIRRASCISFLVKMIS